MELFEKIIFHVLWYVSSVIFIASFFIKELNETRELAMICTLIGMAIVRIIRLEEKNK
jgi:hypothetical protein